MAGEALVIFGASGDLTARKLVPALWRLARKGRLPPDLVVVGTARTPYDDQAWRAHLLRAARERAGLEVDVDAWASFARRLHYVAADATTGTGIARLEARLRGLLPAAAPRVYYLATAPRFFAPVVARLGEGGHLGGEPGRRRIVVEKPFGRDRAEAARLSAALHAFLPEDQIYRIDHYLGKETVQNVMVFRFANAIFEPLWNRHYVDHVQITVAEADGVGHRAPYYEGTGVLRDMVQNHLLQVLALVAMEPPARFAPEALRNEKVKVFAALRPLQGAAVARATARGQYRGYRGEEGVAPHTTTATFAALRLHVDNWRWQGVPFYLRTGKRLARRVSEVVVQFRCPPLGLFAAGGDCRLTANRLTLALQPDEGIRLRFEVKVPAQGFTLRTKDLDFFYHEAFPGVELPGAYERLLLDALTGDPSLFIRQDEIDLAWGFVDAIQEAWENGAGPPLESYAPGSWGPPGAERLLWEEGRRWHTR